MILNNLIMNVTGISLFKKFANFLSCLKSNNLQIQKRKTFEDLMSNDSENFSESDFIDAFDEKSNE